MGFSQTPEEAVDLLENETGIGIRSLALGGSVIGGGGDYSALYWNPAGLTKLESSEISGGMYYHNFSNEALFNESKLRENKQFTALKSLGLAYKFPTTQGSLVMAFGYNLYKDYDNYLYFSGFNFLDNGLEFELSDENDKSDFYPFNKDVLQTEDIVRKGNLGAWSFGLGLQLSPKFSLGAAVNKFTGNYSYNFSFYQDDIDSIYNDYPANFETYELHQTIDSGFKGWSFKIGSLFQLNKNLGIGISVDLPARLHVFEDYHSDDLLIFDDQDIIEYEPINGEWEYIIEIPAKISGGIALDFDRILLSASCEYRDWTQTRFDIPDGFEKNQDFEDLLYENSFFKNIFRPVLSYSVGGEIRVPGSGLKLRGGYRCVPSPFYDSTEKVDRNYISAGIGYDIDMNTTLNFTFIKGSLKKQSEDCYTPGGTEEKIKTIRILAGITYKLSN